MPEELEALRGLDVLTISAGAQHVLALLTSGDVYSWGAGRYDDGGADGMGGGEERGLDLRGTTPQQRQRHPAELLVHVGQGGGKDGRRMGAPAGEAARRRGASGAARAA